MIEFEKLIHKHEPTWERGGQIIFKKETLELKCAEQSLPIGFHSIDRSTPLQSESYQVDQAEIHWLYNGRSPIDLQIIQ